MEFSFSISKGGSRKHGLNRGRLLKYDYAK